MGDRDRRGILVGWTLGVVVASAGVLMYVQRAGGPADEAPLGQMPARAPEADAEAESADLGARFADARADALREVSSGAGQVGVDPAGPAAARNQTRGLWHDQMRSQYLGTFITESPDVEGWNAYLGLLAGEAQLEAGSVRTYDDGMTTGSFVVPGTGLTVDFQIANEKGQIKTRRNETVAELGAVDTQTTVVFDVTGHDVTAAYGTVQFFSDLSQRLYEQYPIGGIYEAGERATEFRPLQGIMEKGLFWVSVPNESTATRIESAGLDWAYRWVQRLQEAQRSAVESR